MPKINPLRLDPTRTTMLRKKVMAEMHKRFAYLRSATRRLIIDEDAFGIKADRKAAQGPRLPTGGPQKAAVVTQGPAPATNAVTAIITNRVLKKGNLWYVYSKGGKRLSKGYRSKKFAEYRLEQIEYFKQKKTITSNTRWRFETDAAKVEGYRNWLKAQVDAGILEVSGPNNATPWLEPYVRSAYRKGLLRAYVDTRKADIAKAKDFSFIEGGKEEFLRKTFNGPIGQSKLQLINTRNYALLKDVSANIDREMTRILTDGLAQGKGAEAVARDLNKSLTTIERKRGRAIARTEIIHAHSEGQLDAFEEMNIEEVGVLSEWSTAGDSLVCPMCIPMEGVVLTIKEARGMIPRHTNCRCTWIPAGIGEEKEGTTRTRFAAKGQGLEEPGTLPLGETKEQVMDSKEGAARIKESVKAEHPKLSTKDARDASSWAGADKTKLSKK